MFCVTADWGRACEVLSPYGAAEGQRDRHSGQRAGQPAQRSSEHGVHCMCGLVQLLTTTEGDEEECLTRLYDERSGRCGWLGDIVQLQEFKTMFANCSVRTRVTQMPSFLRGHTQSESSGQFKESCIRHEGLCMLARGGYIGVIFVAMHRHIEVIFVARLFGYLGQVWGASTPVSLN